MQVLLGFESLILRQIVKKCQYHRVLAFLLLFLTHLIKLNRKTIALLKENNMLAVSIICIIFETIFYVLCTTMVINPETRSYAWIMVVLLVLCTVACVGGLVTGIKGIKDRTIRGKSIATTAVSGFGLMLGFIFSVYSLYLVSIVYTLS